MPQKGKRVNVFGLRSQGKELVTFAKEGSWKADFIVDGLAKWGKTLTKMTVLVLDNAPVHRAKLVQTQLEQWPEQNLFIFFLPTYSPHLNKIEMLWRKIKYEWLRPESYASLVSLKAALTPIFEHFGSQYTIQFKELIYNII